MASIAIDSLRTLPARGPLFVTTTSPSKSTACSLKRLGLSPISTTTAKQTETPRKLKDQYSDVNKQPDDNNNNNNNDNEDAEEQDEQSQQQQQLQLQPLRLTRSDSWGSRAGFSPRPKRLNNPTRRPVQSASSMRGLQNDGDDDENESTDTQNTTTQETQELVASQELTTAVELKKQGSKANSSFRLNNQNHHHNALEQIQEGDDSSADESDFDDDDDDQHDADDEDEYDGDADSDEQETTLQLYKSLSSDLSVRYQTRLPRSGGASGSYDREDDDVVQM